MTSLWSFLPDGPHILICYRVTMLLTSDEHTRRAQHRTFHSAPTVPDDLRKVHRTLLTRLEGQRSMLQVSSARRTRVGKLRFSISTNGTSLSSHARVGLRWTGP